MVNHGEIREPTSDKDRCGKVKRQEQLWDMEVEVMDALTTSNIEDTLHLEEKLYETSEKNWDKMNRMMCCLIRSCLIQDIKYLVLYGTFARKM